MKSRYVLMLALAGGFVTPAIAQSVYPDGAYRNDGTTVLSANWQSDASTGARQFDGVANFRSAYARAGRPKFVILWNREVSDQLNQGVTNRTVIGAAAVSSQQYGPNGLQKSAQRGVVIASETVKSGSAGRNGPAENVDARVHTDFVDTFIAAGIRLVDRNVVMRSVAAAKRNQEDNDTQQIEMEALQRHAQYVIEVLRTPDSSAADGWALSVTVKRLTDGSVVASAYLDGHSPAASAPPQIVASPEGDYRTVAAPMIVQSAGKVAAEQVLAKLAAGWRH